MSVLENKMQRFSFTTPAAGAPQGGNFNGRRGQQRVDANGNPIENAKLWLNIGIPVPGMDAQEKYAFISPKGFGVPLDNLEPVKIRGESEYNSFQADQNTLLEAVQRLFAGMKPGEVRITNLVVQARYANEEVKDAEGTNAKLISEFQLV